MMTRGDFGYLGRAARRSLREDGIGSTARTARDYVLRNFLHARSDFTQQRFQISEELARTCDYTVAYGPFTGMRLDRDGWWSAADRGSMLLGLYEAEVLEALTTAPVSHRTLIDVGAADGYYAIGCLVAGIVDHAYCFEISEDGRRVIAANADANGVRDRITILGIAESDFASVLEVEHHVDLAQCIVIMDIEGGEFDLLTKPNISRLQGAFLIIELHEHVDGAAAALARILDWSEIGFSITFMATGSRNPSRFRELQAWSDDDRWMLCSEGRAYAMRWLVLRPQT